MVEQCLVRTLQRRQRIPSPWRVLRSWHTLWSALDRTYSALIPSSIRQPTTVQSTSQAILRRLLVCSSSSPTLHHRPTASSASNCRSGMPPRRTSCAGELQWVITPLCLNGSQSAFFFLLLSVLRLFRFKTDRRQTSHTHTGDHIIYNCTVVTDFQLSPNYLIIINF